MNSALHKVPLQGVIASCHLAFKEPSYLTLSRSQRYACKFIYLNGRHNKNAKAKEISSQTLLYYVIPLYIISVGLLFSNAMNQEQGNTIVKN
jgi:hypothetical protein